MIFVFGPRVTVKRGDFVSFADASQRFEMPPSASIAVGLLRAQMIFEASAPGVLASAIADLEKKAS
jgi:hypothetical protein